MWTKILMLLMSYWTGKFSHNENSAEMVAAISAEAVRKTLGIVAGLVLLFIGIAQGLMLIGADLLIQIYVKDQLLMTPTLFGGIVLLSLCLMILAYALKPQENEKKSKIEQNTANSIVPLTDALAELVAQYTEERRQEMKMKTSASPQEIKSHLSPVVSQEA